MGKFIVITGVTKGLGRALAEWFIANGHTVAGCGRSAEILDLRFTHPAPHDFSVVDVTDETKVSIWAAKLCGPDVAPDILICNAAVMNTPAPLWKVPAQEFNRLIDVNVKGVATVIRHFAPHMIARGRGTIVTLSSGWGRSTSPEVAPYCASKFAIEGLTQALAQELPSGLAAVPLNPGVIDTDMLRQAWADSASSYAKPVEWAKVAAPFILQLGPKDNGRPATVPRFADE
ncbi:MAG: SDR family NAD(P)-dependent oxidoreductase [Opitutae bacterium]|nr:SDR family NAD(P)-dependent oxidoreductase [Opitutae bacterium]